jgi:hypothetical protein
MTQQYDNTNRGALFKNNDKRDERDPDYRGNININGKAFWLDAWLNESKKDGKKYMALRVKPKLAAEHAGGTANPPARNPPAQTAAQPDFNDEIPF